MRSNLILTIPAANAPSELSTSTLAEHLKPLLAPYEESWSRDNPHVTFIPEHVETSEERLQRGAKELAGPSAYAKKCFAGVDMAVEDATPKDFLAAHDGMTYHEGEWGYWTNPEGMWDSWNLRGQLLHRRNPPARSGIPLSSSPVNCCTRETVDVASMHRAAMAEKSDFIRALNTESPAEYEIARALERMNLSPQNLKEMVQARQRRDSVPEPVWLADPTPLLARSSDYDYFFLFSPFSVLSPETGWVEMPTPNFPSEARVESDRQWSEWFYREVVSKGDPKDVLVLVNYHY